MPTPIDFQTVGPALVAGPSWKARPADERQPYIIHRSVKAASFVFSELVPTNTRNSPGSASHLPRAV
jgi:hypothetical protein